MTLEEGFRHYEAAFERMMARHPRLRDDPVAVQVASDLLFAVVKDLRLDDALEVVARFAEVYCIE